MSRPARRTLSCLFVLAIIVVAVIGWTYLPGSGGVVEELRWLLARDRIPPQHFNRAAGLMLFAEEQEPGNRVELLRRLLFDDDTRVVYAALLLLHDQLRGPFPQTEAVREDVRSLFADWVAHTTVEEKVSLLPISLECCYQAVCLIFPSGGCASAPELVAWELPITEEDHRWIVAGAIDVKRYPNIASMMFRPLRYGDPRPVWQRLSFLDGQSGALNVLAIQVLALSTDELEAIEKVRPEDELQATLDLEEVVAMLNDPVDQVRWAVARVLAVAGDERALPVFCEWLEFDRKNRGRARRANELMTALFGPDWRKPFESGGAASQPGAGDGGG